MRQTYFLVEEFDPSFDYSGGTILSLTPQASYALGRAGYAYTLLQDYYCIKECIAGQDAYFLEELAWIRRLDAFFKQNVRFCADNNINIFMAHFSRFKYIVDTIVMRSYMMRKFAEKTLPQQVIYITKERKDPPDYCIYTFNKMALQILKDIAALACEKAGGVNFSIYEIPSPQAQPAVAMDYKSLVREHLPVNSIKSVANFIGYEKFKKPLFPDRQFKDMRVLILDAGNRPIDFVITELIARGSTVFVKREKGIFMVSNRIERKVFDYKASYNEEFASSMRRMCAEVNEALFTMSGLPDWVNIKADLRVTELMKPYFKHFLNILCVQFLIEVKNLQEFYGKEKIDFVISRASVGENCASAIAASNGALNTKNVCFQHSAAVLDLKDWPIDELQPFDYYFSTDDLSEAYFKFCATYPYIDKCEVLQSPHYLKDMIGAAYRKEQPLWPVKKETVMYITKKLTSGMLRFNTFIYPITWYFEFQKKLIELFGQRQDFHFLFKHSLAQKWAEESIIPYIHDRAFENIEIVDKPSYHYLDRADRVILDYPSTGFFEAAAAGIPVMAFYWDHFFEWKPSVDYFGRCLQPFSTPEEALQKITMFLDDDPKKYITDLPYSEIDIPETLRTLKTGNLQEAAR